MYLSSRPSLGGCQDWAKRAERALTDAKKDNDFIYHERIPEVKALTSIGRAAVVKPTAVPETFIPGEKVGTDQSYQSSSLCISSSGAVCCLDAGAHPPGSCSLRGAQAGAGGQGGGQVEGGNQHDERDPHLDESARGTGRYHRGWGACLPGGEVPSSCCCWRGKLTTLRPYT